MAGRSFAQAGERRYSSTSLDTVRPPRAFTERPARARSTARFNASASRIDQVRRAGSSSTGAASDASTFTISVLNGTNYAEREDEGTARGLIAPGYVEGTTAAADPLARVALRPGVALVLQGCDAQYLALCTVGTLPAGCEDRYLSNSNPYPLPLP